MKAAHFNSSPRTQPEHELLCLTRHKLLENNCTGLNKAGRTLLCLTPVVLLLADRKLLFLIRHGQAWSNYLEEVLGPDLW